MLLERPRYSFPASTPETKTLSFLPYSSPFESWGSSRFPHISSNRSLNPPGFSGFCLGALLRTTGSVSSLPPFLCVAFQVCLCSWFLLAEMDESARTMLDLSRSSLKVSMPARSR